MNRGVFMFIIAGGGVVQCMNRGVSMVIIGGGV